MTDPTARASTDAAEPTANGHPAPADLDAALARARRILGGDVRPDDDLPVPDEVTRAVTEELIRLREGEGIEVSPEAHQRMLNDRTLMHHHGGDVVLARF